MAPDSSITRSAIGTRHRLAVERETVATRRRPSALAASDVYCLDARADAVGNTAFDVHCVDPGPGSIVVGGEVEQRPVVQQGWKGDARVVERQPLGLAAGRANAPDVAFVERQPLDEVDERAVVRPDGKVVVDAWPRNIDLTARPSRRAR